MPLLKTQSLTSKLIVPMCTYGYCIIGNQILALEFTPSWSKEIKDPECLSPTPPPNQFTIPSFTYCATLLI